MAKVIQRRIDLPFGCSRFEYDWSGDDTLANIDLYRVRFNGDQIFPPKIGQEFWLGHLNLVVVDYHTESRVSEVALASGRGYQAAYRRQLYYFWENLRSRIVLTLYVWGLADAPIGDILTWKHIHWGRK